MIFSQTVTKVTASTHRMIYKNELSGENGFMMLLLTIESLFATLCLHPKYNKGPF